MAAGNVSGIVATRNPGFLRIAPTPNTPLNRQHSFYKSHRGRNLANLWFYTSLFVGKVVPALPRTYLVAKGTHLTSAWLAGLTVFFFVLAFSLRFLLYRPLWAYQLLAWTAFCAQAARAKSAGF